MRDIQIRRYSFVRESERFETNKDNHKQCVEDVPPTKHAYDRTAELLKAQVFLSR